tara:strand:+ start:117642 stop:118526 length:885 start_codon:yes stop_codon:yes gene_type:complete
MKKVMPQGAAVIPVFNLYGETSDWPTPDLLHCETIAHRSRQHDWEIKPHRHQGATQLLHLVSGNAQTQLDNRQLKLTGPCLVLAPKLCVHAFRFSGDVAGHVLTLASPLIDQLAQDQPPLQAVLQAPDVFELHAENDRVSALIGQIVEEYSAQAQGRDLMLLSLSSILLMTIARRNQQARQPVMDRNTAWFTRFQALVEARFREHWPLTAYAAQLGITTAHLNGVCRRAANMTALQVIHERLLLEARRSLIYTVMTIAELSDQLGFSDPAYFTRFFTQRCKISPREFRHTHQQS